jgi:phosphoribosylformylglycinamidine cyclo-ligase
VSTEFTYAASGVDIDAGERAVTLMRAAVEKTNRPEVVGGLGGFAGLFALDTAKYRKPLLASSTDGVGTKIALARQLDRHDTVGIDLVAMVVDDLVACGAEPLFLQDYVACGKVVPERIAAIVTGIAARGRRDRRARRPHGRRRVRPGRDGGRRGRGGRRPRAGAGARG